MRRKLTKAAAVRLLVVVLLAGLITVVISQVQLSSQRKALARIDREIATLTAQLNNLDRCIEDEHNTAVIERRAAELGLRPAEDGQMRSVTLLDRSSGVAIADAGTADEIQ